MAVVPDYLRNQYTTLDAEKAKAEKVKKCLDCGTDIVIRGKKKRCLICAEEIRRKRFNEYLNRRNAKKREAQRKLEERQSRDDEAASREELA